MKYIVIETKLGNSLVKKIPLIFPNELVHSCVAGYLLRMLRMEHGWMEIEVVSAGFIDAASGRCYGSSETLELNSDVGDTELIRNYDHTGGLA